LKHSKAPCPTSSNAKTCHGKRRFLAGKCFIDYRRRGGVRRSPLPDFYIGAHAAVTGRALLTRDANRYGSQLPSRTLINP
jgi:predicted nucleic acid-binding protein